MTEELFHFLLEGKQSFLPNMMILTGKSVWVIIVSDHHTWPFFNDDERAC